MHHPHRTYRHLAWLFLSLLGLSACSPLLTQAPSTSATADGQTSLMRPRSLPQFFAVDTLVRSSQLDGVDLHVRYAEQNASGLIVHVAFYNNGTNDLAFVDGVEPQAASLEGGGRRGKLAPANVSASLQHRIAPTGVWLRNGATNGTLQFNSYALGSTSSDAPLRFVFPGFPPVPIRLTLPLREAPEPTAPVDAVYHYPAPATLSSVDVRVTEAAITPNALQVTLTVPAERADRLNTAAARSAVVFDGRWNQLHAVATTLGKDKATITLDFPRPMIGDRALLSVPGLPLLRIPFAADDAPASATGADLPPSTSPRAANDDTLPATPRAATDVAPGSVPNRTTVARADVDGVIRQINQALLARDRAAYLDAFGPELQAEQGALFDRIGTLPLTDVQFMAVGSNALDAADLAPQERSLSLRYAFREAEPLNTFRNDVRFMFRYDDGWRVSNVEGDLPFWAYAPTSAERAGPFWILYRPEMQADVSALAREAQAAFATVRRMLPGRAKLINVMYVTASAEEFTTLTGRPGDRFAGAALSRYRINTTGIAITDQVFFLNGAAFSGGNATNRQQTITHELTHLVLAPTTMPFAPAWLVEGAAMVVSDDLPHDTLQTWLDDPNRTAISLADLTTQTRFGAGADDETLLYYAYSAYLARYIVDTYGMDRFLQLYDSYSATPPADVRAALGSDGTGMGPLAQQLTTPNIRATLGVDLATLEKQFNIWLQEKVRG